MLGHVVKQRFRCTVSPGDRYTYLDHGCVFGAPKRFGLVVNDPVDVGKRIFKLAPQLSLLWAFHRLDGSAPAVVSRGSQWSIHASPFNNLRRFLKLADETRMSRFASWKSDPLSDCGLAYNTGGTCGGRDENTGPIVSGGRRAYEKASDVGGILLLHLRTRGPAHCFGCMRASGSRRLSAANSPDTFGQLSALPRA